MNRVSLLKSRLTKYGFIYAFLAPALLYLIVFQLYPLIETVRLSFTNLSFLRPSSGQYVGFRNYRRLLFADSNFWPIFWNSFIWVFGSLILQYLLALPAAVVLKKAIRLRSLWRGLLLIPWVTPTVIMGLIWRWILEGDYGLLNHYLHTSIVWLGDPHTVWPSLLLVSLWKGFPYETIMFLAGLYGIPGELYEAADIDGCGRLRRFFVITLPMLMPVMLVVILTGIVISWTKFELIWVLTVGGPGFATSVLPTYVYSKAFSYYDMGGGSAVATISMAVMVVFILIYLKYFKWDD
jgi:multiple sugar transport system permease protein